MKELRISIIQGNTIWHNPEKNRDYYGHLMANLANKTDVIVLPETFTSGFSNDAIEQAETMQGKTVEWLYQQARTLNAVVTGSVQIRTETGVFNRLLWVTPQGELSFYDKRHLFRYGGEHERYNAGNERLIVEYKGWRINPIICYDVRFPAFCRNQFNNTQKDQLDFDLQIVVANWPKQRVYAWKTLTRARAIENLCYVVAANRVGQDGNHLVYTGDSAIIDFLGQGLAEASGTEAVIQHSISLTALQQFRESFPAMLDADPFQLL